MALWSGRWNPNPGVPGSKPFVGSKVDLAFHLFEVDQMSSTGNSRLKVRYFWVVPLFFFSFIYFILGRPSYKKKFWLKKASFHLPYKNEGFEKQPHLRKTHPRDVAGNKAHWKVIKCLTSTKITKLDTLWNKVNFYNKSLLLKVLILSFYLNNI